jgi:hypothetical protein
MSRPMVQLASFARSQRSITVETARPTVFATGNGNEQQNAESKNPHTFADSLTAAFDLQPAVAGVTGGIAAADAQWRQTRILLQRRVHRQCASIAASATAASSAIQGFIQALDVFVNTLRSDVVR